MKPEDIEIHFDDNGISKKFTLKELSDKTSAAATEYWMCDEPPVTYITHKGRELQGQYGDEAIEQKKERLNYERNKIRSHQRPTD